MGAMFTNISKMSLQTNDVHHKGEPLSVIFYL
jgi:hypothetical protein